MSACIADQGLGFVVGGVAVADEDGTPNGTDGSRRRPGRRRNPRTPGRSRQRKAAFEPLHVEAFFFHNLPALEEVKAAGRVTGFLQGKQAPAGDGAEGRARRPKYILNCPRPESQRSLWSITTGPARLRPTVADACDMTSPPPGVIAPTWLLPQTDLRRRRGARDSTATLPLGPGFDEPVRPT